MMVLRHAVKLAILVGLALPAVAFGQQAPSPKVELVSDATIQLQRQLTSVHRLKMAFRSSFERSPIQIYCR